MKKILVVDDEPDIAELVKLVLETNGEYEVFTELDPLSAYQRVLDLKPEALLLDLHMPGIDGWEIFKKVRNNPDFKSLPIGILTARAAGFDEMVGLHVMKADAYITKPFGKKELLTKIDELFTKRK